MFLVVVVFVQGNYLYVLTILALTSVKPKNEKGQRPPQWSKKLRVALGTTDLNPVALAVCRQNMTPAAICAFGT